MRSSGFIVKRFTIGLGACALLATATPAAAQGERRAAPVYGEMPDQRGAPDMAATASKKVDVAVRESKGPADARAPIAAPPSPPASDSASAPSGGGGENTVAAPPAAPPSGLSHEAPDTAPSIGVGGGGKSSGGPSPASTPEPSTLLLMGAGLAGLYRLRRRR